MIRLQNDLAACSYPADTLLRHLIALAGDCNDENRLAETALDKAVGRVHLPQSTALVARAAGQLIAAFGSARPRAAEELPLRADPLRSQWEARGPGLLVGMRRLSAADLLVPAASLVLVHPVLGGGGLAHPSYNRVTFEGLLANPVGQLPEVLRLGWLLGQLNFDLPTFEEPLGRGRLEVVGPLALIPVVLTAAEDIELARADDCAFATRARRLAGPAGRGRRAWHLVGHVLRFPAVLAGCAAALEALLQAEAGALTARRAAN